MDPADRAEVVCPHCGSQQAEPKTAVSTFCRACGQYFRLWQRPEPRANGSSASAPPRGAGARAKGSNGTAALDEIDAAFLRGDDAARNVECFDCRRVHLAPPRAAFSNCPTCGARISLRDLDICEEVTRRIRTRGSVTIHRRGLFSGPSLACHHLSVYGRLESDAECTGDAVLKFSGRLASPLSCESLRVENRSDVNLVRPVKARRRVEVRGRAFGEIRCEGTFAVLPQGEFSGILSASALEVERGGSLLAECRIRPEPSRMAS